jgi:hypothetical protein
MRNKSSVNASPADEGKGASFEERMDRLERMIVRLAEQKTETHIHIEHLHIEKAVLEQMAVRLDNLDIEEVSGSLNIGNTFHTLKGQRGDEVSRSKERAPGQTAEVGKVSGAKRSGTQPPRTDVDIRSTTSGLSFRYGSGLPRATTEQAKGDGS